MNSRESVTGGGKGHARRRRRARDPSAQRRLKILLLCSPTGGCN